MSTWLGGDPERFLALCACKPLCLVTALACPIDMHGASRIEKGKMPQHLVEHQAAVVGRSALAALALPPVHNLLEPRDGPAVDPPLPPQRRVPAPTSYMSKQIAITVWDGLCSYCNNANGQRALCKIPCSNKFGNIW
eukprot:COSAG05_NODE_883_length_6777_cov_36.660081_7_plen_137_part_00